MVESPDDADSGGDDYEVPSNRGANSKSEDMMKELKRHIAIIKNEDGYEKVKDVPVVSRIISSMEEHITTMAGAGGGSSQSPQDLGRAVAAIGRPLRQRSTLYGSPVIRPGAALAPAQLPVPATTHPSGSGAPQ